MIHANSFYKPAAVCLLTSVATDKRTCRTTFTLHQGGILSRILASIQCTGADAATLLCSVK